MQRFTGTGNGAGQRHGILVARFNEFITSRLLDGALGMLHRSGVRDEDITVVEVPGAFELGPTARRLAASGRVDAVIVLGCVIRGATAHFDYVAGQAARLTAQAAYDTGVPVIFGVLTTDTIEQAIERAGTKAGNKGADAASAAVEMVSLYKQMG